MKLIYRLNGSDLFVEKNPEIIPQLKWHVEMNHKEYVIEKVTLSYEESEDVVFYDLVYPEFKELTAFIDLQEGCEFECILVWKQNQDSLTKGKTYKVNRVAKRFRNELHFWITDDLGREKKYSELNTQFRRIK